MAERRSHQGWYDRLIVLDQLGELTQADDMLLALHHINNNLARLVPNVEQTREATEHVEGMLGALDNLAATMTQANGIPYAGSSAVRQALDEQRERDRMAALPQEATP